MEPRNRGTLRVLFVSRRIQLLLSLPIAKLDRLVLEAQTQAIGESGLALDRAALDEGAS